MNLEQNQQNPKKPVNEIIDMTNPVPEGVDPKDFWLAVDILDSRYGGKEKYKPGIPGSLVTNNDETYLEKLVRETRQKLPELLAIVQEGKKQGLIQDYHRIAKEALQRNKEQREQGDMNQ